MIRKNELPHQLTSFITRCRTTCTNWCEIFISVYIVNSCTGPIVDNPTLKILYQCSFKGTWYHCSDVREMLHIALLNLTNGGNWTDRFNNSSTLL